MKKVLVFVLVMLMAMTSLVFAKDRLVTKVEVTGIDSPFERTRELDTSGKVPTQSTYRISGISWNHLATGQYEVAVTIIPNFGYIFSGDVEEIEATINGNVATSKEIIEKDEFKMTYLFTEKSETNISSDTLRHRIIAYYDTEYGVISPNGYRVLHGYDQTFKIIPNEGYKIKEVYVDNLNLGPIEEYEFRHVTKSHDIRAFFEKIEENQEEDEENKPVEEPQNNENKSLLQLLLDLIKMFQL